MKAPTQLIRLLVKNILEHPFNHDWSIQGLGMLRLYLSPKVRLHIWDSDRPHKLEGVSELHNHPWDFDSLIVCGQITNHIFWPSWENSADGTKKAETWMQGTIECGPCPEDKLVRDIKTVQLLQTTLVHKPGEVYCMKAHEIHRSEPLPGTVTICDRRPLEDPDHAQVCWPTGEEWVSAEPRTATVDEVAAMTKKALLRLDGEL